MHNDPWHPHEDRAMTAAPGALRLATEDQIATLTFDQPGSRANTLGQAVLAEFEQVLGELEGRKDLNGLILQSGKAGMFIAGADLKELGAGDEHARFAALQDE